jgi:hypothetical protein
MGKHGGKLRVAFAAGSSDKRDQLTVEPSLAHEESRWNRHFFPAVFEDVNREVGVTGSEFSVDVKVVIHTGESGFNGRRLGFALRRICLGAKHLIFVEADNYPTRIGCARRFLRQTNWREEEE